MTYAGRGEPIGGQAIASGSLLAHQGREYDGDPGDLEDETLPRCGACDRAVNPKAKGVARIQLRSFQLYFHKPGVRGPGVKCGTIPLCERCWRRFRLPPRATTPGS